MDLATLLRWKTTINLKDANGNSILDENKKPVVVYMRVVSDWDVEEAYKLARVASAKKREALKDVDSDDFKSSVKILEDASEDECKTMIKLGRSTNWYAEAVSSVTRPDAVKIIDIAVEPDAPTLEEQERLDAENNKIELEYKEKIDEYIKTKEVELEAELSNLDLAQLRLVAQVQVSIIVPFNTFITELQEQKVWRSIYLDSDFKEKAYRNIEHFRETKDVIREQFASIYAELESGSDDLKN